MRKEEYYCHGYVWKRVNKYTAKKAFDNGKEIAVYPCLVMPNSPWFPHTTIKKVEKGIDSYMECENFEKYDNAFYYYNCNDNQTGLYAKYFVKLDPQS